MTKKSWMKRLKADKKALNPEITKLVPNIKQEFQIAIDLDLLKKGKFHKGTVEEATHGYGGEVPSWGQTAKILKRKPHPKTTKLMVKGRESKVPTKSTWKFDDKSVMDKHIGVIKDKLKKRIPLTPVEKEWRVKYIKHNIEKQKAKSKAAGSGKGRGWWGESDRHAKAAKGEST